ncbi:SpaN/EivJ family type III secretion system needle length determinant [Pandoraea sp. PE-S2T-3]|uniref:SpaN/EivJ family type III secretion system needle length determinant n=1 Tax=Pandoraea sp. PE-S2T-3 TaxID=1986993 RepID=UPI001125046C|nr:hypothetical protein [Pandoraea sp. PE-S2T-3]
METLEMRAAPPSPASTASSRESQDGQNDSEVTKAFEQALKRRSSERRAHDAPDGSAPAAVPIWPVMWRAETTLHATPQRPDKRAATETERAERKAPPPARHRHATATAETGTTDTPGSRPGVAVHRTRVTLADTAMAGLGERADVPNANATAPPAASAVRGAPLPPEHRKTDIGATDNVPLLSLPGSAARDTTHAMPLPAQGQRDRPAQPPPGGTDRYLPAVGSDGLRYAFDSWGKGHFVHVQCVQIGGQQGFVLGASDALVQRRLQAMWPGTPAGASRWQLGEPAALKVAGVLPMGDAMQEEGEC